MLPEMIPLARRRTLGSSLGRAAVLLTVCLTAAACGQSLEAKRQATLERAERHAREGTVSYTHLTLPTILRV